MTLVNRIEEDLIAAIKSGEIIKRDTLRMLKSTLKNAEIEANGALSDEQTLSLVQKEIKRRNEAIEIYQKTNKDQLATQEISEKDVLASYLPKQMSDQELHRTVKDYLQNNPTDQSKFGQAMKDLSLLLKGQVDMSKVSQFLRQEIQGK